jgi:cation diffusion facilitator CzcD-associated flavoprotein CzcO
MQTRLRLNAPLPDLSGATDWINGSPDYTALAGHPILVYFWSASCLLCHETLPTIAAWRARYSPQGVQFMAIHVPRQEADMQLSRVLALASQHNIVDARSLIASTGAFHRPYIPQIPGQDTFRGAILHAVAYREPASLAGQRIVVVGAGNSAVQIATELAQVARVTLATREPVRFVKQRPYGRDIHFWWWLTRCDTRPLDSRAGTWLQQLANGKGPRVLDTGIYRAALAAGKPDRHSMFTRFTDSGIMENMQ